jgi:hypothetical protein
MPLATSIVASIEAQQSSVLDLGTPLAILKKAIKIALADGSGANQAAKVFSDSRNLAASANESLDLAGGLTDAFGSTLTFLTVKALIVVARATNTNDVLVGGAGSNAFVGPFNANTSTIAVRPGGVVLFAAPATGWTVTASTGDLLRIANSAGTTAVDYDIIIVGT